MADLSKIWCETDEDHHLPVIERGNSNQLIAKAKTFSHAFASLHTFRSASCAIPSPMRPASLRRPVALLLGLLASLAATRAEVSLPRVLGDNLVLQRDLPVPIWGRAAPGETVTVRFAGQEKQTTADPAGAWRIDLDPLPASAEPRELVVSATNTLTLRNLLVGEVWLCSGQSNMEYAAGLDYKSIPAASKTDAALASDLAGPGFSEIRLFRAEKKLQPPEVVSSGWQEARADAIAPFSAIGFLFARELHRELGVPVGILQAAWGGTRIEVWTPPEGYLAHPAFAKEAVANPLLIDGVAPGKQYAGMVRPLAPFALRGVLWYQGESNVIEGNDGLRYADKFEALVAYWRSAWRRPDLPVYSVQLAPYAYSRREKDKVPHSVTALPELWEAQSLATRIPRTGLVPILDHVHNLSDIHPTQKRPVAERLSKLALADTYGRSGLVHAGPVFEKLEFINGKALVHFNTAAGLKSRDGQPLTHFEIAGADGVFSPADAQIEVNGTNSSVVMVSSPAVPEPKQVRFAWHETAQPNLVNTEGWPAYPFRSENTPWHPRLVR